ncbi:hypothetical protein CANMA_000295 [Candida margitis]|uniref:uncharacterized protein n=1 Tax=Candida margitis TaxID=1775924 RepID=UPI002227D689|nr:uncharacterized protein CANMA_000295 [Candida margitis]KAI5970704.1 hypothetical protein CANMA_000295 [Candida margitis]
MLKQFYRSGATCITRTTRRYLASNYDSNFKPKSDPQPKESSTKVPPHKDGLYFGKFTEEEYKEAARVIKEQIAKLEGEIKGDHNVRENIGKLPQFPEQGPAASKDSIKSLTDFFKQAIKLTGPITLSSYMRQCLTHPDFGYYTTRDPLNLKTGDFITSPEISSVFGEMIGIWYFTIWQSQNKPTHIRFIELGPGKGTLINDVIKTFNRFVEKVSEIKPNVEIVLIEASKVLRLEQYKLLCNHKQDSFETTEEGFNRSTTKWGNAIIWVDTEKDIKQQEAQKSANYIIAHEFFDALPIKSFIKKEEGWRELVVEDSPTVLNTQLKLEGSREDSPGAAKDPTLDTEFHLTISPKETPASMIPKLSKRYKDLPVESRIEICPDAELYTLKIAQLIDNVNSLGAALVVDYGVVNQIPENSLRGIYKHKFVSPFYKPGEVDLSIDVDFTNLKSLSENIVDVEGPINQGDWLHNIGVGYRIDQLLKQNSNNEEMQDKIYGAYRRLTDDDKMGKIYKFMALLPKNSEKPIGF